MAKRFIAGLLILAALVVVVALLAPLALPADRLEKIVEEQASTALGREVAIGGEFSIRFLPRPAFRAENVAISNPAGFGDEPMATLAAMDIGLDAAPLLGREVVVRNFVLREPTIDLRRKADGAANWTIATAPSEQKPSDDRDAPGGAPAVSEARFGDVRIVDGRFSYADETSGASYLFEDVDVELKLDGLDTPFEAEGGLTIDEERAEIDLVVSTLADFLAERSTNIKFEATLAGASSGADIDLTPQDGEFSVEGPVSLDAPDLNALMRLAGVAFEDPPGFDSASVNGVAKGTTKVLQLTDATVALDEIAATGAIGLDMTGARPKLSGALRSNSLDFRPYMPPPASSGGGFPPWSTAAIDVSSLRLMDADLALSAERILLHDITAENARLTLKIDDGRLVADLPELSFYGGAGGGRLNVDSRSAVPKFSGYFDFRSVDAQPLAVDLLGLDRLLGTGGLKLDFTAAGASQAAIMKSISGSAGFDLNDGALRGVNIVELVNGVRGLSGDGLNPAGFVSLLSSVQSETDSTDFTKFLSNMRLQGGVATATELSLVGPFLEMTGSGSVDLGAQTIALRLQPTVQGDGETDARTFTAPLRVGGTFAAPKMSVDVDALAQGELQNLGRDTLRRALGLDDADAAEDAGAENADEAAEQSPAEQLIDGLFGRRRDDDQ